MKASDSIGQFYLNNSKVARVLADIPGIMDIASEPGGVGIRPFPANDNVLTIMRLIEDPDKISLSKDVSHYDICVADGIYTLYKHGFDVVTPEMIARIMDGNSEADVSQQRLAAIMESVDKMRHTFIKIHCGAEMSYRKKKVAGVYESYLIPADRIDVKCDNQVVVTGYKLLKLPALYEYAEKINQIISVPIDLINNDCKAISDGGAEVKRVSERDERIVLRHYIVKRISSMKNQKNNMDSSRISYAWHDSKAGKEKGLYAELGYKESDYSNWRQKRNKIHRYVKEILDDLVSKGFIAGYEEYREGDSRKVTAPIAGVIIHLAGGSDHA